MSTGERPTGSIDTFYSAILSPGVTGSMGIFEQLSVGQTAESATVYDEARVRAFAEVSGDANPIHLDENFAKTSMFGQRIAHGLLVASSISAVLANQLPGTGTVYLSQSLKFTKPVYLGDTITTRVTVRSLEPEKRLVELETVCSNQKGDTVIEGVALTKCPRGL